MPTTDLPEIMANVKLYLTTLGISPYLGAIMLIVTIGVVYDRFFNKG